MSVNFNQTNIDEQAFKRLQAQKQAAYQGAQNAAQQTQGAQQQVPKQAQKEGLLTGLGGTLVINGALSGGYGVLPDIRRCGGIKKAIANAKANNEMVKTCLEKTGSGADSFIKSYAASKNYETLISAQKQFKTAEKIAKKGKVPIRRYITNAWDTICGKGKTTQQLKNESSREER